MQQRVWDRIGPICGLVFVGLMMVVATQGLGGDPGVRPDDPAGEIAAATAAEFEGGVWTWAMALMVALVAFVVFLADVHERLRGSIPGPGRWLATVFLAGGLLVVVAILGQAMIWLAQGVVAVAGGEEAAVAKTLFVLSWEAFGTVIPGVAAMTGAAAVASLGFRALPAWLGVLAAVAFAATFVVYWVPVWLIWVAVAAVTLLVRKRPAVEASAPAS